MIYLLLFTLFIIAANYIIRYYSVKKSIRKANEELLHISEQLGENRILKIAEPNQELESLLITINHTLEMIRKEHISYMRREKEYQEQIENISHDLRTPLTSIIGYLEIIHEEALSEDDLESLQVAKRKADSLQRLITQFYDMARLTGDDYPLQIKELDVGRVLRELIVDHYYDLEERNLDIRVQIPDESILILADQSAMERVFSNLLQNICRYAKTLLEVKVIEENECIRIYLINDTEGFSHEDAERLFERFYINDSSRGRESTGLGLTIAKQLVEKMEGEIVAEAQEIGDMEKLQMMISFPAHDCL